MQTGSGKTHTMTGDIFDPVNRGIVPRAASAIFDHVRNSNPLEELISVKASAVEIYCERIRDLLCFSQSSENLTVQQVNEQG